MEASGPLTGRTALVAGASSGVGAAIAVALAEHGASVALAARRAEALDETRDAVAAHGVRVMTVVADLSEPGAAEEVHARCVAELGGVDILVNVAAAIQTGPVHEIKPKHWDLQLRLNLSTPFHLMQAVLPGMRGNRYGRIINISSAVALEKIPGTAPYAVTKQGLNTLTELTDLENRDLGVRAIALCLGFVYSRLSPDLADFGVTEDDLLMPADVAATVTHLVTMDSRVTTGSVIRLEPTSQAADTRTSVQRYVRSTLLSSQDGNSGQ